MQLPNRAHITENLAAAGYIAGWRLVRLLPPRFAAWVFRRAADAASDNGAGMDQLRRNLARVVGPENVTKELVRDSMRSYARYWLEAFRLPAIHTDPQLHARLKDGLDSASLAHLDASLASGRGVVLALPHTGNWDMAGCFLVGHYGQFTTVAERLKPEALFDAFVDFREELGFEVIALTGGEEPPFERLKATLERGGVVCLLSERDLTRTGVTVNFFGEETTMAAGPAALATETGAALHVVHSWFEGPSDGAWDGGWGLSVSPEIEVTDVQATTQRLADGFAANIAAHPADWHILQPQWTVDVEARRAAREAAAQREGR
ncbi:phosphatidylinositol mannoside acyltransferase [uncultured Corynebacterium sp.]|uniref:phosphatidylinositol mannoside acyltransferase n=1 Tax=uncultured Corynebacterium sp. TaxID=159447 RepID=UPI0025F61641|nr:phosphatidylinositol mannoside acyltransferase [uncultured Corynebacterium sp.]